MLEGLGWRVCWGVRDALGVEWEQRSVVGRDGVHLSPEGRRLFCRLLEEAVAGAQLSL